MTVLLALVVLTLPGVIPAFCMARGAMAAVVAPIVTALLVALGASAAVVLRVQLMRTCAVVFVVAYAATGVALWRRWSARRAAGAAGAPADGRADAKPVEAAGSSRRVDVATAVIVAVALWPLLASMLGAVAWDYHSIWLLHARTLLLAPEHRTAILQSPLYDFSHPDYPMLVPGVIAFVTKVLRTGQSGVRYFSAGRDVVLCLNAAATAALLLVHKGLLRFGRPRRALALTVTLAVLLANIGRGGYYDGFVDVFWSLAAIAGAVLLFEESDRPSPLAVVLLGAAAMTKNEGAAFVVLACLVAFVILRRAALRRVGLPFAVAVLWVIGVRSLHIKGEYGPDSLSRIVRAPSRFVTPLRVSLVAIWFRVAGVFAMIGGLAVVAQIRRVELRAPGWGRVFKGLAATVMLYIGFVSYAYIASLTDLNWHLGSSVSRTTNVVSMAGAVIGVVLLCSLTTSLDDRLGRLAIGAVAVAAAILVLPSLDTDFRKLRQPSRDAAASFGCLQQQIRTQLAGVAQPEVSTPDVMLRQRILELGIGIANFVPDGTGKVLVGFTPGTDPTCAYQLTVTPK